MSRRGKRGGDVAAPMETDSTAKSTSAAGPYAPAPLPAISILMDTDSGATGYGSGTTGAVDSSAPMDTSAPLADILRGDGKRKRGAAAADKHGDATGASSTADADTAANKRQKGSDVQAESTDAAEALGPTIADETPQPPLPVIQVGRLFKCSVDTCGKLFTRPNHVATHMRIHQGMKPFKCPQAGCGASFAQRGNLNVHVKKVHVEKGRTKSSKTRRRKPLVPGAAPGADGGPPAGTHLFVCPVENCGMDFTKRSHLVRHEQTVHLKVRSFKCDAAGCGRAFGTQENLNRHQRKHSKEEPFSCPHCNRRFGRSDGRDKHLLRHLAVAAASAASAVAAVAAAAVVANGGKGEEKGGAGSDQPVLFPAAMAQQLLASLPQASIADLANLLAGAMPAGTDSSAAGGVAGTAPQSTYFLAVPVTGSGAPPPPPSGPAPGTSASSS